MDNKKSYKLDFEELKDILPCALYVLKDSFIIDCNKIAVDMFGYDKKEEIVGLKPYDLSPEKQRDGRLSTVKGKEIIESILNNKEYASFQWLHKRKNGELFLAETKIYNKNNISYVIVMNNNEKDKLMFDELFFASPYAVAILDKEHRVVNINHNFTNMFQYSLKEAQDRSIADLVSSPENIDNINRNIELVYSGELLKHEGLRKRKDGKLIEVEMLDYPIIYNNEIIGVYDIYIDISRKKSNERQLHLFKKTLENNSEGVLIINSKRYIQWINNAFIEITGYSLEEVYNKTTDILKSDFHDSKFYEELWDELLSKGRWSGEIWIRDKKGSIHSEWITVQSIKNNYGKITHYVAIFKDLSEKKKIDRRFLELQQKDVLTQLYNRNYFLEITDRCIMEYEEESNKISTNRFSVIIMDIEGFKEINDSLGHLIGDKLLIEISKRISLLVADDCLLSRFGGDDFAILYNKDNIEDVESLIKDLLYKITQPYNIKNTTLHLKVNIGISRFPQDANKAETLVRYANIAMYKSKHKVNESFCFYSKEMSQEIEQKFFISNYLVRAIYNKELSIYYQPIFHIENQKIVAAEALLRWENSILGRVSPGEFIPVAEKTGQIISIGEWVLEEVCKQINLWKNKGYTLIPIAVNISVKQLERSGFASKVINILKRNNVDFSNIELEITESVSSGQISKIIKNLKQLKAKGIKISMDDFGTGFSSLGQLDLFELDKLKIDKIFVDDLVSVFKRQNLVKSIIAMAKSLNLLVVAEGIETNEQLLYLKNLGCQLGQGYLFSQPLNVEKMEYLLKNTKNNI